MGMTDLPVTRVKNKSKLIKRRFLMGKLDNERNKNNMALQSGSFTDFNVGTDRAERTDDNVLRKFGLRIY